MKRYEFKIELVRNIEETRLYKWVLVFSSLLSETCYSDEAIIFQ